MLRYSLGGGGRHQSEHCTQSCAAVHQLKPNPKVTVTLVCKFLLCIGVYSSALQLAHG